MAKSKNTVSKNNSIKPKGSKKLEAYERIVELDTIDPDIIGSVCHHGRGEDCSVDRTKLGKNKPPHELLNLTKAELITAYRNMLTARYVDDKHITLVKQGKSYFHIGGSGHEALQTAIGMTLESGRDWGWTYYRDCAFVLSMGVTPEEIFLLALGKPEDPATGGRQMPGHYGHKDLRLPSQSSSTGTQYLNAVGTAFASKKTNKNEVVYVASGEGATSEGEFYEAVNWATREKLPVLFTVQDNGYAISVPRTEQSMGSSVVHSFCCYPDLLMKEFDGTDLFESIKAARDAVEYIRAGKGPALLHGVVERLVPHSSSDDQKKYRPAEELAKAFNQKDAIKILEKYLIDHKFIKADDVDKIKAEIKEIIQNAADWAATRPDPVPEDAVLHNFASEESRQLEYATSEPSTGQNCVLVDAINHALNEEMALNDKMVIFGEDVADPKGGVFTATRGLTNKYGKNRVFNSPLAEASIVGVAIGMAVNGYKPVVEIQFGDYIWPAFMQIKNELATIRYRSNGGFTAPVVIRVPVGGYIHGGLCHSQNIEAFFAHIPGLMIAYPSTAADAKGLLKTACRLQDPVIFCEHKGMYRLPFSTSPEPDDNYLIPFGKAKLVKSGNDCTVVTWGMSVRDSLNAIKEIEKDTNKTIELIDLRTIIPWDKDMVLSSIKKTGRCIIVHEDTITGGFGGEISATIVQEIFQYLDAPVMRHAAKHSHIPYAPTYEIEVLPNTQKIRTDIEELLNF